MKTVLKTAATSEPLTLTEVKAHLRIDSNTFAESVTPAQSIVPGAHVIAASYSLKGSGVSVLGKTALVILDSGTNLSGGTVDVKIQEADSDSDSLYADWSGGAFTQVTTANDNAIQEKEYTGTKAYIRVVATVGTATCDFGVDVLVREATHEDDTLLTSLILAAREWAENYTNRRLINQTWYLYLDDWPEDDSFIELPGGKLQSITSITYYGTDDSANTLSATTAYSADTMIEPGRAVLKYGQSWPTLTLRATNGIIVEYVCGYGSARTSVPEMIRRAMLIYLKTLYEFREEIITGTIVQAIDAPYAAENLLADYRIRSL